MNDEPPLQAWRQAIALGQARRQMRIVSTVPVVDVAIAIVISMAVVPCMFIVSASVVFMGASVVLMTSSVIFVPATMTVLVAVFIVSVSVVLRYGNRG